MDYKEALGYIHSFKRFAGVPTLARIKALMHLLGNPQERLKVVHVAGTNGKGSVSTMIAGILRKAGYHTGLYISPFVLDFCERIQINGEMIAQGVLATLAEELRPLAQQVEELTEFELITAMALHHFARTECDVVVLETGLGGRFDATNIVENPLVSVITSIGLDHTEILGNTVEQIAFEKCGILKAGVPVVTSPAQQAQALAVIYEQAANKGCAVVQPNLSAAEVESADLRGTALVYQGEHLYIPLAGKHQIINALAAAAAADTLCRSGSLTNISRAAIQEGIASVHFPARMEILREKPMVLLDGAHNPAGAAALADTLAFAQGRPITAIMGMLADKQTDQVARLLAPCFRRVLCVTPASPRAVAAHTLAACMDAAGVQASAAHSSEEAWQLAHAVAAAEDGIVVICGSLYLAAELRAIIAAEDNEV